MIFAVGIVAGLALPIQTSINSCLRYRVKSPYLASTVSMLIAAIFMLILSLITHQPLLFSLSEFAKQPWWVWIGGLMGDIALTFNVLLLPHLGAVQTIIIPLLGQIITSMLIDNFGWFNLPVHKFSLIRLLGIVVLLTGVSMVIYRKNASKRKHNLLPWQALGILTGITLALQTSTNGALNKALGSPIHAGTFTFANGALIMIIAVGIIQHNFNHLKWAVGHGNPWWIWIGGILGAMYTVGNLFLAPLIGTGTAVVLVLLGNMIGSTVIDKFGLFVNPKRTIKCHQYLGLLVLLMGVLMIQFY